MTNWFFDYTISGATRKAFKFKELYKLSSKPSVKKMAGIWVASIESDL